ncbi:MAG: Asp-tRNA(Asn)/Glu-tRNA(Gln) amidotransferase subunit GatC [Alphaproteobacteria bacterium]
MSLTLDDLRKIEKLAHIKVPEHNQEALLNALSNILGWVDQLAQVDTKGIENYSDLYAITLPERPDVVTDTQCVDAVMANAPESSHRMFAVPKVVE